MLFVVFCNSESVKADADVILAGRTKCDQFDLLLVKEQLWSVLVNWLEIALRVPDELSDALECVLVYRLQSTAHGLTATRVSTDEFCRSTTFFVRNASKIEEHRGAVLDFLAVCDNGVALVEGWFIFNVRANDSL